MEPSRCPGGPPSAGARLSYSEGMFGSCFPGAVGTGCWAEAPGVGSRHRRPGPCAWPVCQPEAVWLGVPVFRGRVRVSCLHVLRSEASLGGRPPAFAHWMCASALPNTGLHCPGLHPSQVPSDRTVGTVITRLWLDMALRHVDVSPPHPQGPLTPAWACRDALRGPQQARTWGWTAQQGWGISGAVEPGACTLQPLLSTLSHPPCSEQPRVTGKSHNASALGGGSGVSGPRGGK